MGVILTLLFIQQTESKTLWKLFLDVHKAYRHMQFWLRKWDRIILSLQFSNMTKKEKARVQNQFTNMFNYFLVSIVSHLTVQNEC